MATVKGRNAHVFSRTRPSHGDQYPIHVQADRDTHYRDIPPTPGSPPYHLDLKEIVSEADYQTIVDKKKLTFHLNGDMGGIKYSVPQELVARGMEADFDPASDASNNPSFLYIVGDCVYFNGEKSQKFSMKPSSVF
jgi:hypothetical protein